MAIRARRKKARDKKKERVSSGEEQISAPPQKQALAHSVSAYRRGAFRRSLARQRLEMPTVFCLTENHEEVAKFLLELQRHLSVGGERLRRLRMRGRLRPAQRRGGLIYDSYADFATMDRITPAAALVLASEYDRADALFNLGDMLSAINLDTWKPEVRSTLKEVGFLSMLGVDDPPIELAERDGIFIVPFLSGSNVNGAAIDELIRELASLAENEGIGDSETLLNRSRVYDGLGEAIQNVEDHAYPDQGVFRYPVVRRWWMTGAVEPAKKRFNLVIYDQGISIPASLPRWSLFGDFKASFFKAFGREFDPDIAERDGETIAQAVQLGRSSTGKSWHGKGLPLMREIVENASDGTLRLYSRCGEYVYRLGKSPSSRSFEIPLTGTLVEWDLYL
jgi:hypothetical protein